MINLEDLKKVKLFDYIGNDTLLKLSEIGNKVAFKKGEHIFRDKDTISSIYIILSGKVALYKLNEAAHKKVIFILGEGVKIRRLYRQMKNATPLKIEKRLAAKLWKLSKDYGVKQNDEVVIDLNISVAYLSDMFGMPRETISRALKILEKENLIRKERKKIIIKDRDKLASYFKGL